MNSSRIMPVKREKENRQLIIIIQIVKGSASGRRRIMLRAVNCSTSQFLVSQACAMHTYV